MTDAIDNEILDILRDRKIDEKLLESRQLEREETRGDLILQLLTVEETDEKQGKQLAARRRAIDKQLREAEASAAAARRERNEIDREAGMLGNRAAKMRGKLRMLADPRIEEALRALRGYADRARYAFKSRTISMRTSVMGDKSDVEESNVIEIGDALATINSAIQQLEILQEQPRGDDLPAVLEEIVSPSRDAVRRLAGL